MIYLVEDDKSIRELLVYTLNNSGLPANGFEKPSEFYRGQMMQISLSLI